MIGERAEYPGTEDYIVTKTVTLKKESGKGQEFRVKTSLLTSVCFINITLNFHFHSLHRHNVTRSAMLI